MTPPAGPVFVPSIPTIRNSDDPKADPAGSTVPSRGLLTRPTIVNGGAASDPREGSDRKPGATASSPGSLRSPTQKPRQQAAATPRGTADAPSEFQAFVAASVGRQLPIFGHDLFDTAPSTFAPVDEVPVTQDYVIGPGDEVHVRAWGQVDIDYRAVVDRNGSIHLPQIGTLTVGGLRYQDLHNFVRAAVARVFRNFELSVTLGQLRSIQVFVVGQARHPGAYTISSLSTLVNALFASGGPSTKGSMRAIEVKRGDRTITRFDMYDLLLKGDKSKDVRLMPGDVIYIPPVGDLVAISGSVNKPAIYEVKTGAALADLVQLAGGLSTVAAGQRIKLERIVERRTRRVDELDLNDATMKTTLQDGDLVQVYALSPRFENAVTLRGAVANPGRFPWREGMRVRDLIPEKEALIVPDYWQRVNRSVHPYGPIGPDVSTERPRVDLRRLFDEINWDYASIERLNPADLTTTLIPFNLGRAVLEGDPGHNIALRPGDVLTIFYRTDLEVPVAKQTQFVRLEGEVRTAGVYQILPGETLRQLVTRIGGFTPNAYMYGAEFTRESVRLQQQKRLDETVDRLSQEVERTGAARAQASIDEKENVQASVEAQRRMIDQLRRARATGRVVLEVTPDRSDLRDLPELALEDGDRFVVPARPSTVNVIGSVYNQTAFIHTPDKRVSDYLELAGGTTPGADKGRIYVIRADGSVTPRATSFLNLGPSERLNPGDTIVVPENLERFFLTKQLRDWTQVFYQFALGVAGLKVLRDF
ncbi:MAG TPA: SLBB domain-containing protein [Burkholderiales bacterium]|nr:SLBB domain-containing protein [Burkholderiales bacterium]